MSFDPVKLFENPLDLAHMAQQLFSARPEKEEISSTQETSQEPTVTDSVEVNEQTEVLRNANEDLVIQSQTLQSTLLAEKLRRETIVEEKKEEADSVVVLDREIAEQPAIDLKDDVITVIDDQTTEEPSNEQVNDKAIAEQPVIDDADDLITMLNDQTTEELSNEQPAEDASVEDLDVSGEVLTQIETSSTQTQEDDIKIVENDTSEKVSASKEESVKASSVSEPQKKKKLTKSEKKKIKTEKKKQKKLEKKNRKKAAKQVKADKKAHSHHTKNKEHNKKHVA